MQLLRSLSDLPLDTSGSAVTIGFFDGVHLGHQTLLRRTVEVASEEGLTSVAVTFDRHPREVLTPGKEPRLLTTTERKADLIAALGIEVMLVIEFTQAFADVSADDFVAQVLTDGLRARHTVVGANFTFGHRAMGNPDTLAEIGADAGFTAETLPLLDLDGKRVSSSSIREAVAEGDLAWPELALGRRFAVGGEVVTGHGRGHGLGYPTANLQTWPRLLLPGRGIYAGRGIVTGGAHVAAIDVGTNPTFGTEPLHIESFLLDFDGDLRGQHMDVEFWARLRDEVKFDSEDELVRQIADDVERTRAIVPPA
ncbi:MAG: bifunctional riboflavin kinase/FAD synthetase [Actinomycetota bacterium]